MALTKVTGQVINDTTGLVVGVTTVGGGISATDGFFSGIVTAVGDASFSGNVSVGGTLTYEDVTNIDAVGLVTARNGIVVGSGITLSKDGDGFFTGVVTATSYAGDGSALTGIDATQIVTGNTSVQTVDTGSDGHVKINTEGSERLRVGSGGDVSVGGHTTNYADSPLEVRGTNAGGDVAIRVTNNSTDAGSQAGVIFTTTTSDFTTAGIGYERGGTADALRFYVGQSSGGGGFDNATERIRIGSSGQLGIAGANYGTSGQVLQSQGSGSAVQWATPVSGWVHGAEVSLNGNVSITLTDVPDGASHIRYLIRYMSFSGVAQAKVQLQKSTTGGSKSLITSNYQSFSTYFATSGSSSGGGGNTDSIDIFDAYSATTNNLFGSIDIYRIGTNGSDGTNYLIEHQGFANYNGTLSANFMTNAYIELGSSSTDFISGIKFYGNTGESFDNGYVNQSYLLS